MAESKSTEKVCGREEESEGEGIVGCQTQHSLYSAANILQNSRIDIPHVLFWAEGTKKMP